jgi:glutamyl-Q tRNA(Asp) synthetase
MMTSPFTGPVTRFAPSPTGFLHLGHVASALHARDHARGGPFLIRIEDIDSGRCLPPYTEALLEDLDWLGFASARSIRRQSAHLPEYRAVLDSLRVRGLVYPCTCSRQEIARAATATAPDGSVVYPGTCRDAPSRPGVTPVWRLAMDLALEIVGEEPEWIEERKGTVRARAGAFGDVVLGRRDNGVSYHLCVTHDDQVEGIDLVTRGMDLYDATSVHRVLQELLGYRTPSYAHHPLLLGQDGRKLSKRDGAEGIRVLRAAGMTPANVIELARNALERARAHADQSGG